MIGIRVVIRIRVAIRIKVVITIRVVPRIKAYKYYSVHSHYWYSSVAVTDYIKCLAYLYYILQSTLSIFTTIVLLS